MSAESFSEPARSTMLNFEVMIGLDVLSGRLSNEIKITAWDLELNSFETVDDIVHLSFPERIILSASAALCTSISFKPGTWIPLFGSSIMTSYWDPGLWVESKSFMFSL